MIVRSKQAGKIDAFFCFEVGLNARGGGCGILRLEGEGNGNFVVFFFFFCVLFVKVHVPRSYPI